MRLISFLHIAIYAMTSSISPDRKDKQTTEETRACFRSSDPVPKTGEREPGGIKTGIERSASNERGVDSWIPSPSPSLISAPSAILSLLRVDPSSSKRSSWCPQRGREKMHFDRANNSDLLGRFLPRLLLFTLDWRTVQSSGAWNTTLKAARKGPPKATGRAETDPTCYLRRPLTLLSLSRGLCCATTLPDRGEEEGWMETLEKKKLLATK